MSHLRTIEAIKGLKGKLGFLKTNDQPAMEMLRLANSIRSCSQSSKLGDVSLDQI